LHLAVVNVVIEIAPHPDSALAHYPQFVKSPVVEENRVRKISGKIQTATGQLLDRDGICHHLAHVKLLS
jgi:hypothetical protein